MTTDNIDNKFSTGSSDYAEILRHAVAVIEHARTEIARHVNGYVSTTYWEIGQQTVVSRPERTLSKDGCFTTTTLEHEEIL